MFYFVADLIMLIAVWVGLLVLQMTLVEDKLKNDKTSVSILYIGTAIITLFSLLLMNLIISNVVNIDSFHAQIISLEATIILFLSARILARVCVRVAIDRDPFYTIDQQLYELSSKAQQIQVKIYEAERQQEDLKKLLEKNEESIDRYEKLARKAISSDDESKARYFLEQKQQLERATAHLENVYTPASEKLVQLQEMYTQLTNDISLLETHRKIIEVSSSTDKTQTDKLTLDDIESNTRRILDEAQAMSELEIGFPDEAEILAKKYKD